MARRFIQNFRSLKGLGMVLKMGKFIEMGVVGMVHRIAREKDVEKLRKIAYELIDHVYGAGILTEV